jgi:hypothetical protein
VEEPIRPSGRHPPVSGVRGGAGSLFRLDPAARRTDGTGPGRGQGTHLVFVHNHLHTVHAIAACNAAEMAMGMLMEATVPRTHRWIPKAMTGQYLAKATTSLRAQARLDPPDFSQLTGGVDLVVPVRVTDRSGTEVARRRRGTRRQAESLPPPPGARREGRDFVGKSLINGRRVRSPLAAWLSWANALA